jgi:cytochrome c-type biogenesis protein CcmH
MNTIAATALLLSCAAFLTPQQATEVQRVEESLLAPCCYSQSIGRHMSEEAQQMRREVTEMVAAGRSEKEILEHYKALYGQRILIVPDGRAGKILFALPVAAFMACSGMLFLFLRKMLKPKVDSRAEAEPQDHRPEWLAFQDEIEGETGDGF